MEQDQQYFITGGVVNNTYADATEGAAGVIKRSTQAQASAVTPTDNLTAMTPVRVSEHVTKKIECLYNYN